MSVINVVFNAPIAPGGRVERFIGPLLMPQSATVLHVGGDALDDSIVAGSDGRVKVGLSFRALISGCLAAPRTASAQDAVKHAHRAVVRIGTIRRATRCSAARSRYRHRRCTEVEMFAVAPHVRGRVRRKLATDACCATSGRGAQAVPRLSLDPPIGEVIR